MAVLTKNQIVTAESLAREALEKSYPNGIEYPVDVALIARKIGLKVVRANFADSSISGYLNRETREIIVSNSDTIARQAFTIAHELGHYFLHQDSYKEIMYRDDIKNSFSDRQTKVEEAEANCFAAAILMPEDAIRTYLPFLKSNYRLADFFGVSLVALHWRMKNLNIVNS